MKRIANFVMVVAFSLILTAFSSDIVKAAGSMSEAPSDYGEPISVITYVDDEGCTVTERTYFYSNSSAITRAKSGEGWYKNEKTKEWVGGDVTTYYAQGYFVWGDGDVDVYNASGYVSDNVDYITITNKVLNYGTGNYIGVFNKYGYVTYSFTTTNLVGMTNNFSVTIRVSESGNTI